MTVSPSRKSKLTLTGEKKEQQQQQRVWRDWISGGGWVVLAARSLADAGWGEIGGGSLPGKKVWRGPR